jgi:Divergent InlB B-repeat domain
MEKSSTLARLMVFCLLTTTASLRAVTTNEITFRIFPPASGGMVTGEPVYTNGSDATVTASTTNDCYVFESWNVLGKIVTNNPYTFTVTKNETLTANFAQVDYEISTGSSPAGWGIVLGGGKKGCGTTPILTAMPKFGFAFTEWTSSQGATVTNNPYKFTVNNNDSVVAHFKDIERPTIRILRPGPLERISSAAFIVEESASDNVSVAAVSNNLNGAGWQAASKIDNTSIWYNYVTLKPNSTNTLSTFAVDTSGNFSTTNTIKFICTAEGLAPLSIAGQLTEFSEGTNVSDSFFEIFDSAGYVRWSAFTNNPSEVGTYTYTPTGPNAAELVPQHVLPPQETGSNGPALELTFTDAYDASFTNISGGSGNIFFQQTEESVPVTLDGFVFIAASRLDTNYQSTNSFDNATFTTEASGGTNSAGTYTFTPFTQVAALLIQTYTDPPSMVGTTNYSVLLFFEGASPPSGLYSSQVLGPAGLVSTDTGTFTATSNKVTTKFKGPASLAGWQAQVTPTIAHSPFFTRSFGQGTFASISPTNTEPTDVGLVVGNSRITTNTGSSTLLPLAPPYAVGQDDGTVDVTWKTSTTVSASAISSNVVSGQTANLIFRRSITNVPVALSGHAITTIQSGKPSKFSFSYNNITGSENAAALTGTYTYAPFTPVMALVTITETDAANAGEVQYLQLYYTSRAAGNYVNAKPDTSNPGSWTFKSGSFTMK